MQPPKRNAATNADHIQRIDKVLNFIEDNLQESLSLDNLAAIASYSPFHFHRIFSFITGENLNSYINRRRMERAASLLIHRPLESITAIAIISGFESLPSFSHGFNKHFGISPTKFRKSLPPNIEKQAFKLSNNGQIQLRFREYLCTMENLETWFNKAAQIDVKRINPTPLLCVTSIGINGIADAYNTLLSSALPLPREIKAITLYHDSLKVTHPDRVRVSACLQVDKDQKASGHLHTRLLGGGRHLVASMELELHEFEPAWVSLFIRMRELGYKKADAPVFVIHHNNYKDHPQQKSAVELCIPII